MPDPIISIGRRREQQSSHAHICKKLIQNNRLSARARAIMCYLLSHGNDWEPRFADLVACNLGGEKALRAAFRELVEHGYARLIAFKDEKTGEWKGKRYIVSEVTLWAGSEKGNLKDTSYPLRKQEPARTTRAACVNGFLKFVPPAKPTKYATKFGEFLIRIERHSAPGGSAEGWTKTTINKWARHCRSLVDRLGGDWKRLKRVMFWYFEHWNDHQYIPQCFDFYDFADKFGKIEAAMQRKKTESNREHKCDGDIKHKRMTVQEARDEGWSEREIREAGLFNR